jgi:hypothetical protein
MLAQISAAYDETTKITKISFATIVKPKVTVPLIVDGPNAFFQTLHQVTFKQ